MPGDRVYPLVAHACLAWKSSSGDIHVQTIPLGNNAQLIHRDYGLLAGDFAEDQGLTDFEDPIARRKLAREMPLAEELVRVYEGVVERTAKERAVDLRLVYAVSGKRRYSSYGAIVKSREEDLPGELAEIERGVDALKEAYRELVRIEFPDAKEW